MRCKIICATFVFALITLVAGCSKPGSEYVGKWQNTKDSKDQFEIVRNGESFLIKMQEPNLGQGQKTTTVPAVVKDGILQTEGGFFTATFTYVKATGLLTTRAVLGGDVEYRRTD